MSGDYDDDWRHGDRQPPSRFHRHRVDVPSRQNYEVQESLHHHSASHRPSDEYRVSQQASTSSPPHQHYSHQNRDYNQKNGRWDARRISEKRTHTHDSTPTNRQKSYYSRSGEYEGEPSASTPISRINTRKHNNNNEYENQRNDRDFHRQSYSKRPQQFHHRRHYDSNFVPRTTHPEALTTKPPEDENSHSQITRHRSPSYSGYNDSWSQKESNVDDPHSNVNKRQRTNEHSGNKDWHRDQNWQKDQNWRKDSHSREWVVNNRSNFHKNRMDSKSTYFSKSNKNHARQSPEREYYPRNSGNSGNRFPSRDWKRTRSPSPKWKSKSPISPSRIQQERSRQRSSSFSSRTSHQSEAKYSPEQDSNFRNTGGKFSSRISHQSEAKYSPEQDSNFRNTGDKYSPEQDSNFRNTGGKYSSRDTRRSRSPTPSWKSKLPISPLRERRQQRSSSASSRGSHRVNRSPDHGSHRVNRSPEHDFYTRNNGGKYSSYDRKRSRSRSPSTSWRVKSFKSPPPIQQERRQQRSTSVSSRASHRSQQEKSLYEPHGNFENMNSEFNHSSRRNSRDFNGMGKFKSVERFVSAPTDDQHRGLNEDKRERNLLRISFPPRQTFGSFKSRPMRGKNHDERFDVDESRFSQDFRDLKQPPTQPRESFKNDNYDGLKFSRGVKRKVPSPIVPISDTRKDFPEDQLPGPYTPSSLHSSVKRTVSQSRNVTPTMIDSPLPSGQGNESHPVEFYERLAQVGEGTYGKVYKARNTCTGELVALKRIRMEGEKDGFPVTALREIKLLQSLRHQHIVQLHEMMSLGGAMHMVFEYMDHDLTGVLSHPHFKFQPKHIKSLIKQMLEGLGYLHHRGVLHRDIKGSNILLNSKGELKLADFGLARYYQKRKKIDYTNRVITLWYRSPELLLGATVYGPEVDIWSAGCIILELFVTRPVFQGNDEIHQLELIFKILGTPSEEEWPGVKDLPWWDLMKPTEQRRNKFRKSFEKWMGPGALDLAEVMLALDPAKRPSCAQALEMAYFTTEEPPPEVPIELGNFTDEWHEYESKLRKRRPIAVPKADVNVSIKKTPSPPSPLASKLHGEKVDDIERRNGGHHFHDESQRSIQVVDQTDNYDIDRGSAPLTGMAINHM